MLNKLLENLKLSHKLGLAFVVFSIPLVLTIYFLMATAFERIDFSAKETQGLVFVEPSVKLLQQMAIHRGASAAFLHGNEELGKKLPQLANSINNAFKSLDDLLLVNDEIDITKEVNLLKQQWRTLENHNKTLSAEDSFAQHNEIVDGITVLIIRIADISNLTLDPDIDTYYLMAAVVIDTPNIANNLGIARAVGASVLIKERLKQADNHKLLANAINVKSALNNVINGKNAIFQDNSDLQATLSTPYDKIISEISESLALINEKILNAKNLKYSSTEYFEIMTTSINDIYQLNQSLTEELKALLEQRISAEQSSLYTKLTFIIIFLIAGIILAYSITKNSVLRLNEAITVFDKIGQGNLDNQLANTEQDEFGELFNALDKMQVTLKNKGKDVGRLSSAVEGMETNLMMADLDGKIVYANPAVTQMLSRREKQLRTVLPAFSVDTMVGSNFDSFHKNPAHQQNLLGDPANMPYTVEINIAGLTFQLIAIALKDEQGEHIGSAAQWLDITEEKDAQSQVKGLIDDAISGQLESRIDTRAYNGFMKGLGESINGLMDTIVTPITDAINVAQALSKGNLTQTMDGEYAGQFLALSQAMNGSIKNLNDMVEEIRSASTNVYDSAREIAAGNNELSHRTESQASSLEETASAMEELTSTVQQNAENATQASRLSASVMDKANNGGAVVENAVTAMADINKSSRKIADIISVIDEIAFQTNLLALNAAVEAARAGEQGRGFAVVAAEVRNLAQRSAGAAKEIKGLINDSVEAVGQGTKLVDETGQTFVELVSAIEEVGKMLDDIDGAGKEQSAGIGEVSAAVSQMDEMTQQNAALVEEASASSKSMEEQSQALLKQVSFFNKTDELPQQPEKNPEQVLSPIKEKAELSPLTKCKAHKKSKTVNDQEWEEF